MISEADFVFKTKKTSWFKLELIGLKSSGAMINVWEKMVEPNLDHIETPSDDRSMRKLGEVHFMWFVNALEEWKELKNNGTVLDLLMRNG